MGFRFSSSSIVRLFSVLFFAAGLALTGVSLFTEHWIEVQVTSNNITIDLHRGLLQWLCISNRDVINRNCIAKYSVFPGWLKSVFICMCISFSLQVIALFFSSAALILKQKRTWVYLVVTFLAVVNFILLAVSIGIFGGKANNYYLETYVYKGFIVFSEFGWSYWLAVIAVVFGIVTSVIEGAYLFFSKELAVNHSYPTEAMTAWKFTM